MSAYFPQPAPVDSGKRFLRTQTNEAALARLQQQTESRPDKILALCSDTVRLKPTVPALDGQTKIPTLEYFHSFLLEQGITAELNVISVPDSMSEADQTNAISAIIENVSAGDSIYIDLSGGMRDTAMLMVAVARFLQDVRGAYTRQVLYAELQGTQSVVRDANALYNLYDLITAVDSFFSTGSVAKLQQYLFFTGEKDPAVLELLNKINNFSEDLALCKVSMLKADLKAIAKQLKVKQLKGRSANESLSSLLYQLMTERFEQEFSALLGTRSESLPALVHWCTKHGLYQQALTLLSEGMPEFVCAHVFVQPTGRALDFMALQPLNSGHSWIYPLFHYHFCRAALFHENGRYVANLVLTKDKKDTDGVMLFRVATKAEAEDYLTTAVEQGELLLDETKLGYLVEGIMLYQSVQQYRNQINHASDNAVGFQSQGLLPLNTTAVEKVLNHVGEYLLEVKEYKPIIPDGIVPLNPDKKF